MYSAEHYARVKRIIERCKARRLKIVTAESCTGGLLGALFTEIPGSSAVYERGFITYSNEAKTEALGVDKKLIEQYGAVSAHTAKAMAQGAIMHSHADIALSITGVAGPGGGTAEKPVGLVWFGVSVKGGTTSAYEKHFSGDRQSIRLQAVEHALVLIEGGIV